MTGRTLLLTAVLSSIFTPATNSEAFSDDHHGSTPTTSTISNVVSISTSSMIVAKWLTKEKALSFMMCAAKAGRYIRAIDGSHPSLATTHENGVAGLTPSTLYRCRITATNSSGVAHSTFSLSTQSEASTSIKGLTFGPPAGYDFISPKIRCPEIRITTAARTMESPT